MLTLSKLARRNCAASKSTTAAKSLEPVMRLKRAMAVAEALKANGVADSRIELKKPEQINAGDAAEARRVDVTAQ